MSMVRRYAIFIAISVSIINIIFCATIGSDTSVQRFNTQQTLVNGDRVAGFAALAGGFQLLGMSTSAIFDCFFGVSGQVALNAGTLILNRDLIMQNAASITSFGNITGNNHIWSLSSSISSMPLGRPIDCSVTFTSSTETTRQILSEDWSYTDTVLAVGIQSGGGSDLFIYAFNNGDLVLQTSINLANNVNAVAWHPTRNTLAVGLNSNGGNELFIYTFDGNALVQTDADEIGGDVASLRWNPTSSYLAVGTTVNTAEVIIYPFNSNNTLDKANKFSLNIAGNQNVNEIDWNITGSFLAIARDDDLYVYQFSPLPTITMTLNATGGLAAVVNTVSWNLQYPTLLAIGLSSVNPRLRIFNHNSAAGTLTQVASSALDLGNSVNSVQWNPECGNCLALGKNQGGAQDFRVYLYDPITAILTIVSAFNFANHIRIVRWMRNGAYIANGSDADLVSIYQSANTQFSSCFVLSDLEMHINTDITLLDVCLIFSGNSVIYGKGNTLSLSTDAMMQVASNSSLLLSNIVVQGINDSNLQILDNTSTLSLQDAILELDGNFSFTVGKMDIIGDVHFAGNGDIFTYRSTQASTIQLGSSLILDSGITFSYAPTSNANSLLQFINKSSQLRLNSATLFASIEGLNLIKGTLLVDGFSLLSSVGANLAQAISFGNGVSSVNNMAIEFLPAGVLSCNGFIVDNNV